LFQGLLLLLLRAYRQGMPRLPRNVLPEYATFHATARGVAHMPIYDGDSDRRWFLTLMSKAVEDFDWQVHAFCLMTNHYHLVVEGLRDNLSDGMKLLNGEYAQLFNGRYKRWGHVFGDRFWCRAVEEEHLENTCRYVMANPVRAGLCKGLSDWPWSACRYDLG
jgi:putative transposase